MTNYVKIDILWADFSAADNPKTGLKGKSAADYGAETIMAKIRAWQPGIIINNRFGRPGETEADFCTPEQFVPKTIPKRKLQKTQENPENSETSAHPAVKAAGNPA